MTRTAVATGRRFSQSPSFEIYEGGEKVETVENPCESPPLAPCVADLLSRNGVDRAVVPSPGPKIEEELSSRGIEMVSSLSQPKSKSKSAGWYPGKIISEILGS